MSIYIKLILLIICILPITTSNSQDIENLIKKDSKGLKFNLEKNTEYPSYAYNNCISGSVLLKFKIFKKGNFDSFMAIYSISDSLTKEAIRSIIATKDVWDFDSFQQESYTVIVPFQFYIDCPFKDMKSCCPYSTINHFDLINTSPKKTDINKFQVCYVSETISIRLYISTPQIKSKKGWFKRK